jgi:hypothetical protein
MLMPSKIMLSVIYAKCPNHAECHYAECHYAERHYAECHYAERHYAECRGTLLTEDKEKTKKKV